MRKIRLKLICVHQKYCVVVGGTGAFIGAIYRWDADFGRSSCWCTSCVFFVVILHPQRWGQGAALYLRELGLWRLAIYCLHR